MKIVIDGQVFAQRHAGMYRYANEILMELDKKINYGEIDLIIPSYTMYDGRFRNIHVIKYGNVKGILWTQISLLRYCKKHKVIPLGFTNTTPILKPGIVVIHDIGYKVMKDTYSSFYGKISSLWHRLNYWVVAKSGLNVITVSENSKKEISEVYKIPEKKISVISNAWQHFNRIIESNAVQKRYPQIKKEEFYFAVGSLEERKNFRWIINVAKKNKDELFIIAGKAVANAKDKLNLDGIQNVLLLGFIEDEEVKWLMRNCKAFLFPSIYEGFGIPPLEAMSVGARVLCSSAAPMPEICGSAVSYFDPYDYDVDLKLLTEKCELNKVSMVLDRYSWEKSAEQLKIFLKKNAVVNRKDNYD